MFRKIKPKSKEYYGLPDVPKKRYPTISFDLKDLPEAKDWEPGKEYKVALKLKQTGLNINKNYGDARFNIIGIKVIDSMPKIPKKKNKSKKREVLEKYLK